MHIPTLSPPIAVDFRTSLVLRDAPRGTVAPWLRKNSHKWVVHEPLKVVLLDLEGRAVEVTVPAGYVTDLSSIPRILWRFYPPGYTESRAPSVLHDYMYSHLHWHMTKKQADIIFREGLLTQGMPKFRAWLFYRGVRLGGRGGWK